MTPQSYIIDGAEVRNLKRHDLAVSAVILAPRRHYVWLWNR